MPLTIPQPRATSFGWIITISDPTTKRVVAECLEFRPDGAGTAHAHRETETFIVTRGRLVVYVRNAKGEIVSSTLLAAHAEPTPNHVVIPPGCEHYMIACEEGANATIVYA